MTSTSLRYKNRVDSARAAGERESFVDRGCSVPAIYASDEEDQTPVLPADHKDDEANVVGAPEKID